MDTNRLVYVQRTHVSQGAQVHVEEAILLPDDSLVQYTVTPEEFDERIIIRVLNTIYQLTNLVFKLALCALNFKGGCHSCRVFPPLLQ